MSTRFRVNSDIGVNVRALPNGDVVGALPNGAVVEATGDGPEQAGEHVWQKVSNGSLVGWVAIDLLQELGGNGNGQVAACADLTDESDHQFSFGELLPCIQAAADARGADVKVVAGILAQESSFKNWRVHFDHTGHGLIGLDDNGLLPDFEKFSGLAVGRGDNAVSIPPGPQIDYLAMTIAGFTGRFGSAINAARVWHRGPGLWKDARGDQYESLIRGHITTLFG